MPIGTEPYDGSGVGGSGGSQGGGLSLTSLKSTVIGIVTTEYILATASGSVTTAAQIFSTPNVERHAIKITNCDASDALYIGFTSDVSATKFTDKLAAGESTILYVGWSVSVYLFASAACDYCCHELGMNLR